MCVDKMCFSIAVCMCVFFASKCVCMMEFSSLFGGQSRDCFYFVVVVAAVVLNVFHTKANDMSCLRRFATRLAAPIPLK